MKKKKLTPKELVELLINKQLEPFNKTIEDVKNEENWFQNYEVSEAENQKWQEWGTQLIMKNAPSSLLKTRKWAEKEMRGIDLMWGLKIKDK